MNLSCLSGIRSVAGQVTWLREGPYRPPGKASVPLITTWALPSACEVAVWVKTACLLKERATLEEWMDVWSAYEGVQSPSGHKITFDLHPCARSKAGLLPLPLEATPWKNTPLFFSFFWQYIHASFRNTSKLTHSCHNRHVGGDAFFLGQGVDLYFRPLLRDTNLNIMIIGN